AAAAATATAPKAGSVVRPPVQLQPRPRPYNFAPAMGMMPPGLMMGMGAGFAGMGAMQPMGGFMPPGMMMHHQQRPGMMGHPPLGMMAGQWNGGMTAPPMSAASGLPVAPAAQTTDTANGHSGHSSHGRARGDSQSHSIRNGRSRSRSPSSHSRASYRDRDRNRNRSRHGDRNIDRSRSKSPSQKTPPVSAHSGSDLLDIGPEPNPEHPSTASTGGEPMDTPISGDYMPSSAASGGSDRRSEASRSRRRDHEHERDHNDDSGRDRGRSHRRDDDRDYHRRSDRRRDERNDSRGRSRRDDRGDRGDRGDRDGRDGRYNGERRDGGNRSRSPVRKDRPQRAESRSRRSRHEGRSRRKEEPRSGKGDSGNSEGAKGAGMTIRGKSAAASVPKTESGSRGSIMDRIRDDRPSAQQGSSGDQKRSEGRSKRRNRR
ncbi:hypothetical protein J3B02_003966, partial [Coemansia erecta]